MSRSTHRRMAAIVVAGGVLSAGIGGGVAHADTTNVGWSSWYGSGYGLDANIRWITAPINATVLAPAGGTICKVTLRQQVITAAPWTVSIAPDSFGNIIIDTCDGETANIKLDARRPFAVDEKILNPTAAKASVGVTNSMPAVAHVEVIDAQGLVVGQGEVPAEDTARVNLSSKKLARTTAYTVKVTSESGPTLTSKVISPVGWSPMDILSEYGSPVKPCSVVPWYFNTAGKPSRAKTLQADVQPALNKLSKETGLTFTEVKDASAAKLTFYWQNMGKGGPSARGGPEIHTSGGEMTSSLHVAFNRQDHWVDDTHAGLGYRNRMAGRGWLIIHETMHTLGFDHVSDRRSVMSPVNSGQHAFTRGDLEGLHALYQSQCAKTP